MLLMENVCLLHLEQIEHFGKYPLNELSKLSQPAIETFCGTLCVSA